MHVDWETGTKLLIARTHLLHSSWPPLDRLMIAVGIMVVSNPCGAVEVCSAR